MKKMKVAPAVIKPRVKYRVTSEVSVPFESEDAEEAIYIYLTRKEEKGVMVAMYCYETNEWVILGDKRKQC